MTLWLRDLICPGHFLNQKLRKACPMSFTRFQRDLPGASATISEKNYCEGPSSPPYQRELRFQKLSGISTAPQILGKIPSCGVSETSFCDLLAPQFF